MAKKWSEVIQNPEFQALDVKAQEKVRDDYFKEVVAPQVDPSQIGMLRMEFDADTKGTIGRQPTQQITQPTVQPGQPQQAAIDPTQQPPQQAAPQGQLTPDQLQQQRDQLAQMAESGQIGTSEYHNRLDQLATQAGMTTGKRLAGLGRAIVQGATFGFGDEAEATLKSILDPTKSREEHLASTRAKIEEFKQYDPTTAMVAEIGGSLATLPLGGFGLGAAKLGTSAAKALGAGIQGAKTAGRVAGITAPGVAQAGLYGAGAAEGGLEDRLAGAGTGALTGALFGAPLAAAGQAGKVLAKNIAKSPTATTLGEMLSLKGTLGTQIRGLEDQLAKTFVGASTGLSGAQKATMEKAKRTLEEISPNMEYEQIADFLKGGLNKQLAKIDESISSAYNRAEKLVGGSLEKVPANTNNLVGTIDNMLNSKSITVEQARDLQRLKDNLASRQYDAKGIDTVKKQIGDKLNGGYGSLDDFQAKQLYRAARQDKYDAVKAAGGDEALNAFKEGDVLYQNKIRNWVGSDKKNSPLARVMDREKGSAVAHEIVRGGGAGRGGDFKAYEVINQTLDPDDAAKLNKAIGRASLLPPDKDIKDLTAGQLDKAFDRLSERAKKKYFGDDLGKIEGVMDVMEKVEKRSLVPSGTPAGILNLETLSKLGPAALGLAGLSAAPEGSGAQKAGQVGLGIGAAGLGTLGLTSFLLANPRLAQRALQGAGGASKLMPYLAGQASASQNEDRARARQQIGE